MFISAKLITFKWDLVQWLRCYKEARCGPFCIQKTVSQFSALLVKDEDSMYRSNEFLRVSEKRDKKVGG